MKIRTDENGYVTEYAAVGDIQGGIEYSGGIPEAFEDSCWQFRLQDGELTQIGSEDMRRILRDRFGLSETDIDTYMSGGE